LNKAQAHVFPEVKEIRRRLPFKLRGAGSDNGGEFINGHMHRYCTAEKIAFTRGRPYRKNDGCHIEQKNWSIVRQTVGYGRFETEEECAVPNMAYDCLRLLTNFFMPSTKLIAKERDGGRIVKSFEAPLTPYRRVLASRHVPIKDKQVLTTLFTTLNPAELRREAARLAEEPCRMSNERQGVSKPPQDDTVEGCGRQGE